jgi:16S rRNA (guanine527-N7)-methyltransferase
MSEDEARAWLAERLDVPRETLARLDRFAALLTAEAARQNLIAASTVPAIWSRHIVDSAQLLALIERPAATWLDLGSGAGFPGLVIAALTDAQVTLVDSRKKRVAFLDEAATVLAVRNRVTLHCSRVETMPDGQYDAISARAFAPLDRLLPLAHRFARPETIWLLPKGRSAASELEAARSSWQGAFRIEPSVTDPEAAIIVATHVKPRGNR